jgi:hypothetical protein
MDAFPSILGLIRTSANTLLFLSAASPESLTRVPPHRASQWRISRDRLQVITRLRRVQQMIYMPRHWTPWSHGIDSSRSWLLSFARQISFKGLLSPHRGLLIAQELDPINNEVWHASAISEYYCFSSSLPPNEKALPTEVCSILKLTQASSNLRTSQRYSPFTSLLFEGLQPIHKVLLHRFNCNWKNVCRERAEGDSTEERFHVTRSSSRNLTRSPTIFTKDNGKGRLYKQRQMMLRKVTRAGLHTTGEEADVGLVQIRTPRCVEYVLLL